jgi:hypothetical protein
MFGLNDDKEVFGRVVESGNVDLLKLLVSNGLIISENGYSYIGSIEMNDYLESVYPLYMQVQMTIPLRVGLVANGRGEQIQTLINQKLNVNEMLYDILGRLSYSYKITEYLVENGMNIFIKNGVDLNQVLLKYVKDPGPQMFKDTKPIDLLKQFGATQFGTAIIETTSTYIRDYLLELIKDEVKTEYYRNIKYGNKINRNLAAKQIDAQMSANQFDDKSS